MTDSAHDAPISLDLTREEAWVVHAAVIAAIERLVDEERDPTDAVGLRRSLEVDETFEEDELESLLEVLRTYAEEGAPSRDREAVQRVINDVEAELA